MNKNLIIHDGGEISPVVEVNEIVVHVEPAPVPAIPEQTQITHRIRPGSRVLYPPVLADTAELATIARGLLNTSLGEDEALSTGRRELTGILLQYEDGRLKATTSTRIETAVAVMPVTPVAPSAPWQAVIPAEAFANHLHELTPPGQIELAPGERFHVGPTSYAYVATTTQDSYFLKAPERPDLNSDVAFQFILARSDVRLALKLLEPIVNNDRYNESHIWADPRRKMMAANNGELARLMRVDIRAKPRMNVPAHFHMPLATMKAAYVLDNSEFILFTILRSSTDRLNGRLVAGGLDSQNYYIVAAENVQHGVRDLGDHLVPPENSFTVTKKELAATCARAVQLFDNPGQAEVKFTFGQSALDVRSQAVEQDISEEVWIELPYLRQSAPTLFARERFYRPQRILEALEAIPENEDTVNIAYPRRAVEKDPCFIYGADGSVMTIVAPVEMRERT